MALNLDMVGKKMDPVPFTYDADRVILYALGIGADRSRTRARLL